MIRPWAYLEPKDRETLRTVIAFLKKRLAEQGTIDWALNLKPGQRIERMAIEELLTSPGANDLAEPWVSAWRLIEESWSSPQLDRHDGTAIYGIQQRLRAGDRSGATITAIVDLVAPRLKVQPIGSWRRNNVKKPRKPKSVEHILFGSLTSGDLIDLEVLELAKLNDIPFLASLANSLEAAVNHGLDIAGRLGRDGQGRLWQLGGLKRAHYVADAPFALEDGDPDAYHRGIAPSVKLLHAVVERISEIDPAAAQKAARRWKANGSPVHLRLWAAVSRNEQITPTDEVIDFLNELDRDRFWDAYSFPEITELRAVRFRDMNAVAQRNIVARIRKGPPRHYWPKKVDSAKVKNAQLYWSLWELRRIEVGGGVLPDRDKTWLDAQSAYFPDLAEIKIDEGFLEGVTVNSREAKPDAKFDTLSGFERLRALEAALGTGQRDWDDDPAERANDWINQPGNAEELVADFQTTNNSGGDFPKVWNRFGWAHRPRQQNGQASQATTLSVEPDKVLGLLDQLSGATLSCAIDGICAWLDAWRNQAIKLPLTLSIWLRLWPIAVEVTNQQPENFEVEYLSTSARVSGNDSEPMDLDTLNTPAGKLVSVFLAACPSLQPEVQAFSADSMERQMRDVVIASDGRSGLIAKHRMIEALPYFLRADRDWAQEHLIAPLLGDDVGALALWRAVARRTHFTKVLETIGAAMAERTNDCRLGRETRSRLVFSLVIESLHAFREDREPAVPHARIQQMLRTLDDEVRASAANTVQKFLRELSASAAANPPEEGEEQEVTASSAALFRTAAAPFLREVWPQERSLATPGVSNAFADLPAASGEAFAEAVDAIVRFLVPFECWSMLQYGLYGEEGETKKLAMIDSEPKAKAFLRLLDLTVGHAEGSVVPSDLSGALEQIRTASSLLANDPAYRRLETVTRR